MAARIKAASQLISRSGDYLGGSNITKGLEVKEGSRREIQPLLLALKIAEGPGLRNAGSLQQLEESRRQALPWRLQKELSPASTLFQLSESHFRLLSFRTIRELS